jgi:hypothetical protein
VIFILLWYLSLVRSQRLESCYKKSRLWHLPMPTTTFYGDSACRFVCTVYHLDTKGYCNESYLSLLRILSAATVEDNRPHCSVLLVCPETFHPVGHQRTWKLFNFSSDPVSLTVSGACTHLPIGFCPRLYHFSVLT